MATQRNRTAVASTARTPSGSIQTTKKMGCRMHDPHTTASTTKAKASCRAAGRRRMSLGLSGVEFARSSSMSGRLPTSRMPRSVARAMIERKQPAVQQRASDEKVKTSLYGTSKTKAATKPESGDITTATSMPMTRATRPTTHPS